jgi:O-antigen ligase
MLRNFVAAKSSPLNRLGFGLFWLFVFAIPWENLLMWSDFVTVSHMMGLVAFPVALLGILESRQLRGASVPLALMGLFVMWGSLSLLWTADQEATSTLVMSWIENLGMVWLIWELADRRERQLALMKAYVFGTLVSAVGTILSYLNGSKALYQRYAASGFDPNDLALLLAISLPISCYLALIQSKSLPIWFYRLQQATVILAIGLTSSRAGLIATIVALSYLVLAFSKMSFQQKCGSLLIGAITVGSALSFLPETSWKRWSGIGREMQQGTWGNRKLVWAAGWDLFEKRPVRGVGAGAFGTEIQRVWPGPPSPIVAHNTFLSILIEEGLIGFGLFLVLLINLILAALQLPHLEASLWLVTLATWATGVFSLTWEGRKPSWFLFGLLIAWSATKVLSTNGRRMRAICPSRAWAS